MRRYVFAAILASSVSPASSARLVNGSFEPSAPATVDLRTPLNEVRVALPGWMVTDGNIDLVSTFRNATSGGRNIALNGTRRGTISTTASGIAIGRSHDLRLDMAASPVDPPNAKTIRVSAGLDSATFTKTRTGDNRTTMDLATMDWGTVVFSVTATAADELLTFRAMDGGASGAALDNGRLALHPVPLPATAPLAVLALAALALLRRRSATNGSSPRP